MWSRENVKHEGRLGFKMNYWPCVVFGLLLILSGGAVTFSFNDFDDFASIPYYFYSPRMVLLFVLSILTSLALAFFVLTPIQVSSSRFFLVNQLEPARFEEFKYAFHSNYLNIVLNMFMMTLFISIGLIVFVVPGIILFYMFRMVPYILSENPDMKFMDTLKLSTAMMKGNKWDTFVYDLSFLGWFILGALTFGILNVFYVTPYKAASDAQLYIEIRNISGLMSANTVVEETVVEEPADVVETVVTEPAEVVEEVEAVVTEPVEVVDETIISE